MATSLESQTKLMESAHTVSADDFKIYDDQLAAVMRNNDLLVKEMERMDTIGSMLQYQVRPMLCAAAYLTIRWSQWPCWSFCVHTARVAPGVGCGGHRQGDAGKPGQFSAAGGARCRGRRRWSRQLRR